MIHIPVLLKEVVKILNPKNGEFIIDGTVGAGGHSAAILERISPGGVLLGIDWDKKVIEEIREKITANSKLILIHDNYANLPEILKENNLPKADGLILDLGMSSVQLERSGRGFSFLRDEILDMRYSPNKNRLTAAEVINSYSEKELADIFWKYGEERYSRKIAKRIIEERRKKRILTTFDLVEIIRNAVPRGNAETAKYRAKRLHPATKVFQALRIYVNRELENLEKLLKNLDEILKPGGRAAIISFHSLEDRLVKNYFREMAKNKKAVILTKKPIRPSEEEIKQNSRSRSAKLRAVNFNL